ncbi:MAG TPA: hypothetical protein PK079_03405 [Leptospiraceae bacterium]|nr:hypothetical protein [Leptospiraceae bacterium]HMW03801.1 hypothetical protein [Leptospiraceae bacterium]HMX34802.1 hypothetical protein [Leptospiraceae bacterium]HMY29781.1 hypothetical protein [Leptospiraceae bacterium]HMZ62820.1 hypothetical protein [Leptospiraceae bacterium]
MSQIEKLLAAHIEYEVSAWKGEKLKSNLQIEVESLYDTIVEINFNDLIDKNYILDSAKNYLQSREIQKELENLAQNLSESTYQTIQNSKEPLTSLLTKSIFEESMNMGLSMTELRKDVVHNIINSPVYTKMISSVLYNAIAEFIGGENSIAKNVPVASSLFKLGQDFLGNIPGMQANIEKNVTAFIQANLQNSLKQSEKLLNQELDAKTSKELTDELWNFISKKEVADLQHYANKNDIKKILSIAKSELEFIKASPLLIQILEGHIDVIQTQYKDKKIKEILSLYKVEKKDITDNLIKILTKYLSLPEVQSHIQKRITARLEGFYASAEARNILK